MCVMPCHWLLARRLRTLRSTPRPQLLPERIDRHQAAAHVDVPENPTVARRRALHVRADAVDRADLVAEHDGAVGARGVGDVAGPLV